MPILFRNFLKKKLDRPKPKGGTYWRAFSRLAELYDNAPPNWFTACTMKQVHRLRQLDKFEPAITYYLISALVEATNNLSDTAALADLLTHAFPGDVGVPVAQQIAHYQADSLQFEAQIVPNQPLRNIVKHSAHLCPVAYHRKMAVERKRARYEAATRLDCFIGDRRALGEDAKRAPGTFGLGAEAKFTSDIDDETTYSPHRNQIARIVEVGHQRCDQFVFLLIAPRSYRQAKSRFYVYKMEEYRSANGIAALRRDILMAQTDDALARWIQHMGWLDWEHIVEFLYPEGRPKANWNSTESMALQVFLADRRLWPF